jgi:hypothetical protein
MQATVATLIQSQRGVFSSRDWCKALSIAGWSSGVDSKSTATGSRNLFVGNIDAATAKRQAEIGFLLFAVGAGIGLLRARNVSVLYNGPEMVLLAKNLVQLGSYANPSPTFKTGLSAANPPLYPFFLALLMKVLRSPVAVTITATVANIVADALTAAWLPRISWLFYGSLKPGIVAACLWLLQMQLMPGWDTSFTLALLVLFCLFTATTIGKDHAIRDAFLAGLIAAALFLFNPSSLLVFGPWIGYLLIFRVASMKRTLSYLGVVVLIFGMAGFAWALRNHRALGAFTIRTNLGMTLYASNNDCAMPSLFDDIRNGCYGSHHPAGSYSEALIQWRMGEVAYDHMRTRDTEKWARTHPRRFAWLTAMRIRDFWFPPLEGNLFINSMVWATTILSLPGLMLMAKRRQRVLLYLFSVQLIYPLMYYIVVSGDRYRYPELWLSLLPAGYFVCWVATPVWERWAPGFSRSEIA